jgi:hypothetical protein
MRVDIIEPNFTHREREPRYFVMQIGSHSSGYADGFRFEIQLCNEALQAGAVILFRGDESEFSVPEFDVPQAVYRAALRQPPGTGDFVDSEGESVQRLC